MSIFASFDCSISRASRTRSRALSMLLPTSFEKKNHEPYRPRFKPSSTPTVRSFNTSTQQFEKIFIHALVRAGQCSRHAKKNNNDLGFFTANKSTTTQSLHDSPKSRRLQKKYFSTRPDRRSAAQGASVDVTRDELKELVDFYSWSPDDESKVPSMDFREDGSQVVLPPDPPPEDEQIIIEKIIQKLKMLLEHEDPSHDLLWNTYQYLPQPRAFHLPDPILGDLLHHLSVVPFKTEPSMLRYLSLIEDVQAVNKPIKASHWTSAIAFAGRCLRRISASEVESALHLWRRMEQEAGIKGTNVTFNVLFDIATKAGKFVLAEMIMKEMETRNLKFNRHFRTGIIYHYGMRRDGNAVRKAYRDLVDAGEIVDSAVITCVIASLLKCGEAVAAEQVFERAKRLHWQKMSEYEAKMVVKSQRNVLEAPDIETPSPPPLPPSNWRAARNLGINLDQAAHLLRKDPDPARRNRIQTSVPLAPSIRTYRALIYYHAVTAGDIDRATELLNEMEPNGVELDGIVYLHLFKGFSMHGGVAYTGWTRRRLERLWKDFCGIVERDGLGWRRYDADMPSDSSTPLLQIYLNASSTEYVLRAYAKVAGYERAWEIWHDIKSRWGDSLDIADEEHVDQVLDRLHPEWRSGDIGDEDDGEQEVDTGEGAWAEADQEIDVAEWEDVSSR